jgi:hypothetical protein
LIVAAEEPVLVSVRDPDGREVVLLACIENEKIALDYPELVHRTEAVTETVDRPDHVEPDDLPSRTGFYGRNVGPSRWLLAVAS